MQKIEFICDIGIVQNYLANWGEKQISVTGLPKILTKKDERGERNDVIIGVRKELNFGNDVTEIPFARIPNRWSAWRRRARKGEKKTNCGNQVAEIQEKGGERKKDYGNQVAENGMKKRKREKNSDQKILNDVSTKEQA